MRIPRWLRWGPKPTEMMEPSHYRAVPSEGDDYPARDTIPPASASQR